MYTRTATEGVGDVYLDSFHNYEGFSPMARQQRCWDRDQICGNDIDEYMESRVSVQAPFETKNIRTSR